MCMDVHALCVLSVCVQLTATRGQLGLDFERQGRGVSWLGGGRKLDPQEGRSLQGDPREQPVAFLLASEVQARLAWHPWKHWGGGVRLLISSLSPPPPFPGWYLGRDSG